MEWADKYWMFRNSNLLRYDIRFKSSRLQFSRFNFFKYKKSGIDLIFFTKVLEILSFSNFSFLVKYSSLEKLVWDKFISTKFRTWYPVSGYYRY